MLCTDLGVNFPMWANESGVWAGMLNLKRIGRAALMLTLAELQQKGGASQMVLGCEFIGIILKSWAKFGVRGRQGGWNQS